MVVVGILYALRHIIKVLVLLVVDLVWFAFIGYVLFSAIAASTSFATLASSVKTMLLILTAPGAVLNIMEPIYDVYPLAACFFVISKLITTFIVQKFLLASTYRSFKSFHYIKKSVCSNKSTLALCHAFDCIARDGAVDRPTWRRVFSKLHASEAIVAW